MSKDLQITVIRARLAKVTPGPWEHWDAVENGEKTGANCILYGGGTKRLAYCDTDMGYEQADANGEFIAKAPADIDFLLRRIEYLEVLLNAAQ